MIKKICITVIVVFLLLVGYGAWIGSEQNQRGVSLFEVAYTYNAMNPISRIGYGRCEQVPDMRSSYSSGAHPRGTS